MGNLNQKIAAKVRDVLNSEFVKVHDIVLLMLPDYATIVQELKNFPDNFIDGSYASFSYPKKEDFEKIIVQLNIIGSAYKDRGLSLGNTKSLAISLSTAGVRYKPGTDTLDEIPEDILSLLLDSTDDFLKTRMSESLFNTIKAIHYMMVLFPKKKVEECLLNSAVLMTDHPQIVNYPNKTEILNLIKDIGYDDSLKFNLSFIANNEDNPRNYNDEIFGKLLLVQQAYTIVQDTILTIANFSPSTYWMSQRLRARIV